MDPQGPNGGDGTSHRLSMPEPPPGIGTGFLTDYWQSQRSLPVMQGPEVLLYYLQQGMRTVLALPTSSVITVLTIAVSLFLLAGFLLVLQNVDRLLSEAGNTLYVTAYIKDTAEPEVVTQFVQQLENNPRVREVEYISKERALDLFREDLGPRSGFLEGLDQSNPLPASVDIVLQPEELDVEKIDGVLEGIRAQPVVEELVYGSEWVDRMQRVIKIFRAFGMTSLLVALGIIVFLISNTIKLVIYARRDEIGIMQLVGASATFVRIPFVLGGLMQGLAGSALGLLLLKGGFTILNYEIRNSTIVGVALPDLVFLNVGAIILLTLVGLIVGAVGSLFALRKFMNV
ncbi:MAG: ABC transporter permease [Bdellovibrionales bacterium]|nr:ABC transporter permease [Bdellovibrionales bacterium]